MIKQELHGSGLNKSDHLPKNTNLFTYPTLNNNNIEDSNGGQQLPNPNDSIPSFTTVPTNIAPIGHLTKHTTAKNSP